jgi:hypothetical protein
VLPLSKSQKLKLMSSKTLLLITLIIFCITFQKYAFVNPYMYVYWIAIGGVVTELVSSKVSTLKLEKLNLNSVGSRTIIWWAIGSVLMGFAHLVKR